MRMKSFHEKPMPNQTTTSSFSVMIQPAKNTRMHPDDHREGEAEVAGPRLLLFRELRREDRDEDDVVDAEHDLEHEQRHEDGDEIGGEGEGEVHRFIVGVAPARSDGRPPAAAPRDVAWSSEHLDRNPDRARPARAPGRLPDPRATRRRPPPRLPRLRCDQPEAPRRHRRRSGVPDDRERRRAPWRAHARRRGDRAVRGRPSHGSAIRRGGARRSWRGPAVRPRG